MLLDSGRPNVPPTRQPVEPFGARVAVAARGVQGLEATERELGVAGIAADLATEEGCETALGEARAALGPIDILVNNLGGRAGSSWSDTGVPELETWVASVAKPDRA